MADAADPLHKELLRLLTQITEARENGNFALADLLTDLAAKCLMKIADVKTPSAPAQEPEQPAAQQQQQIQSDKDDKPKT